MKAEISEAKKTPIEESAKISSSGAGDNRLTELHEEHERETTALKVKVSLWAFLVKGLYVLGTFLVW